MIESIQLETYVDSLEGSPDTRFVISLGPLPHDADYPPERCLEIVTPDLNAVHLLSDLDPAYVQAGISVHINTATYKQNPKVVIVLQSYIAYWFVKFIQLPLLSTKIPDDLGVRKEHPDDPVAEINKLQNLPLLLSCPLLDKAKGAGRGYPAILLIPGPSLNSLRGKLKSLSEKAVIICISRTFNFALEEGVEPDILIQLDASFMQRQLFPERQFANTYLFANSLTPIHDIAPRFRHTFFVDSFNTAVLPNPYRPRESWLSSLLLCLGAAETLQFAELHLAGVDLSFPCPEARYYDDQAACSKASRPFDSAYTDIPRLNGAEFVVPDMHGNPATTTLQYYATAFEAEMLVQEIMQSTKTLFFNLTNAGILSSELIQPTPERHFEQHPIINRERLQKRLDAMSHLPEEIRMGTLQHEMDARVLHVKHAILRAQGITPSTNPAECAPMLKSTLALFIDNPGIATPDDNFRFGSNLLNVWLEEAIRARKIAMLYREARTNPIPLLCSTDEFDTCALSLKQHHPRWSIDVCTLTDPFSPPTAMPTVAFNQLYSNYLNGRNIVLITSTLFKKYGYLLKAIPADNILEYSPDLFL